MQKKKLKSCIYCRVGKGAIFSKIKCRMIMCSDTRQYRQNVHIYLQVYILFYPNHGASIPNPIQAAVRMSHNQIQVTNRSNKKCRNSPIDHSDFVHMCTIIRSRLRHVAHRLCEVKWQQESHSSNQHNYMQVKQKRPIHGCKREYPHFITCKQEPGNCTHNIFYSHK